MCNVNFHTLFSIVVVGRGMERYDMTFRRVVYNVHVVHVDRNVAATPCSCSITPWVAVPIIDNNKRS